ncbi:MAG: GNAT family N-acetyltransferase [Promethearchaeota archaeon]
MKQKIPPREVTLKDGTRVTLRTIEERDLDAIWDNFNDVVADRVYLPVLTPVVSSFEKESWYEDLKLRNEICVVGEVEGAPPGEHVASQCTIENVEWETAAHVGVLGIIVKRGFRDKGLGRETILHAIEHARNAGKKKLNLAVFSTNERAISLYQKLGFEIVGRRKKQYKYKHGKYFDEVLMDLEILKI